MPRRTMSKRLRFEVFKRDGFRCRYCGATPGREQLHVDHVIAVVNGGTDDISNLVTACEPCNLGKSDVPLDERSPRTAAFADLVVIEPRLGELAARAIREARAEGAKSPRCGNAVWYGYAGHAGIKPEVVKLVGWRAVDPILATKIAYDTAYQYLYDIMPGCSGCGCLSIEDLS